MAREHAVATSSRWSRRPSRGARKTAASPTWINEVFVNSSQLYYPKGSLTGLLLDISIRDATDNRHSLDEVARSLYTRFYKQGKGFRTADLLALLTEARPAGRGRVLSDATSTDGTPLPYEQILPKAGIAVERALPRRRRSWVSRPGPRRTSSSGVVPGGAGGGRRAAWPETRSSRSATCPPRPTRTGAPTFRRPLPGQGGDRRFRIVVRRDGQVADAQRDCARSGPSTCASCPRPRARTPKAARIWHGLATGTVEN